MHLQEFTDWRHLLDDDCEEGDEECENEFSKYVSSDENFQIFHERI